MSATRFCLAACLAACAAPPAAADSPTLQLSPLAPGVYRVDADTTGADAPGAITVGLDDAAITLTVRPLDAFGRAAVPGLEWSWPARPGEVITGLGERFDALDQAGKRVEMWIEDAPLQPDAKTYYAAPILYSSAGYALAATDNPEGVFDLDSAHAGLNRYQRAGTTGSLIVVLRPTLDEQLRALMPRLALPEPIPDWAWGPWISRNSYETQAEAEAALAGMRERRLPVAAIVQEAWKGPSEQGQFNQWASPGWPDPTGFLNACTAAGVRNILWQVPVLHPASPRFAEAEANGYLVRRPDGSVSFREAWLAGFANIDMTNPAAVAWWQDLMRPLVRAGVAGFKADDGEDIKATDVFSDGRRGWQLHNEYSVLYARAIDELLDEEGADGILWARSGSLGQQRHPALWAGDQAATWEQLRTLIPAGLSVGLSGMPFWGHDIGGYAGQPSPELYIRWLQLGTLSPMMQYHGVNAREPWAFGDEADRAYAFAARARMNLVPHLRSLAGEAARTGVPIMRPMAMVFPSDPRSAREDSQYMLGADLLVAPVLEPGAHGRRVRVPEGRWRLATQRVIFEGPSEAVVPVGMVDLPLLVRANASLELALPEGGSLGDWREGTPAREVADWDDGPMMLDPSLPVRASSADTPVTLRFKVAACARPRALWRWADASGPWHAESAEPAGDGWSVDLTPPPDERRPGRRQAYRVVADAGGTPVELLAAEIAYRAPLDLEPVGPTTITGDRSPIAVRARNPLDEPFEGTLAWRSGEAPASERATRDIRLAPGESAIVEWSVRRPGGRVGTLAASVEARQRGRVVMTVPVGVQGGVRWAIAGPFDAPPDSPRLFGRPLGPEFSTDADVAFAGGTARWRALDPGDLPDAGRLDFNRLLGRRDFAAAYAMTKVRSDRAQPAELRFGSDDTLVVWVNGELAHAAEAYRSAAPDQEIVPVRLRGGVNTIVAQVAQDINAWELLFRLTGPRGGAIAGVADGFDDFASYAPGRAPPARTLSVRGFAWSVAGPYPWADAPGEASPDLPSDRIALDPAFDGWSRLAGDPGSLGGIDLAEAVGLGGNRAAYLRAEVESPLAREVTLRAGSDDGLVVWVNGERVWAREVGRVFRAGEDEVRVRLRAGVNTLVFRVSQLGGEWRFQGELYDRDTGTPIRLETR